jgi:hypothetical protein
MDSSDEMLSLTLGGLTLGAGRSGGLATASAVGREVGVGSGPFSPVPNYS